MNYQQEFEKLINAHKLFTNDIKYAIENVGGPPHMPIFCYTISISKKVLINLDKTDTYEKPIELEYKINNSIGILKFYLSSKYE